MRLVHRAGCVILLFFAATCWAQKPAAQQWQELVGCGKTEEARTLCTSWVSSTDIPQRVEAYKCLANLSVSGKEMTMLEANDAGGGVMRGAYAPEAVDEALGYLRKGLEIAPQDLSLHQGRLHLLENASRFDEMAAALDDSCRIYKGKEGANAWIAYTSELFESQQYKASLELLKVLLKHFPKSHDVVGNIGAMHMALKQDAEALPFLERAVEMAPDDSIDAWNLGRFYDFTGKTKEADLWYRKALKLKWEDARELQSSRCHYAVFVELQLHEVERACGLERAHCPSEQQTACSQKK